jgi:NAD(P)-dependent dehydrogenase (short-subunit alcohol dehydrogenase family)
VASAGGAIATACAVECPSGGTSLPFTIYFTNKFHALETLGTSWNGQGPILEQRLIRSSSGTLQRTPLDRFGTAEDAAEGVAFLASPGARYITGTTIEVNGGMSSAE